ncbi:hypothetical protein ACP4OV_016265 [Aristida adscensionis]
MNGDLSAELPYDVLADVLGRLGPRDLAVSRCVRRAWRDVVDGGGLLRAKLLPHYLAGVFLNFHYYTTTELFSRPSTARRPSVSGRQDFLPQPGHCRSSRSWSTVIDHCNGLLLVKLFRRVREWYVLNPATGWVAPLPTLTHGRRGILPKIYLVYDPAISPCYEVFWVPHFHDQIGYEDVGSFDASREEVVDPMLEHSEWPPPVYNLDVFSSATGRWEERSFVREGHAASTVADMREDPEQEYRNAVYCGGALYVHCQTNFVMRISLSIDKKYQVIKPPVDYSESEYMNPFQLVKSQNEVHYVSVYGRCRLRVWILKESSGKLEWLLKHDKDLTHLMTHELENLSTQVRGSWTLQDINYYFYDTHDHDSIVVLGEDGPEYNSEASAAGKLTWISDDEDNEDDHLEAATIEWGPKSNDRTPRRYCGSIEFLAYHPYKEIVFLGESTKTGLAYHLNSSKLEYLGNLYPKRYNEVALPNEQFITSSFPYTPCRMGQMQTGVI